MSESSLLRANNKFYIWTGKENLLYSSEVFNNTSYWELGCGGNLELNGTTTSPSGNSAQLWRRTAAGATIGCFNGTNKPNQKTFERYQLLSIFAKKSTATQFAINLYNSSKTVSNYVTFTWTADGVLQYNSKGGGITSTGYGVKYFGDGWSRCWISLECPTNNYGDNLVPYIYPSGFTVSAALSGTYIWGASLQQSTSLISFPCPYYGTLTEVFKYSPIRLEFPVNPLDTNEVINNKYASKLSLAGTIARNSRLKDTEIRTLKWPLLDYEKYAWFVNELIKLKYSNINKDVILEIPSYLMHKDTIINSTYITIRVLDVRFEYGPKHTFSIELSYLVVD